MKKIVILVVVLALAAFFYTRTNSTVEQAVGTQIAEVEDTCTSDACDTPGAEEADPLPDADPDLMLDAPDTDANGVISTPGRVDLNPGIDARQSFDQAR